MRKIREWERGSVKLITTIRSEVKESFIEKTDLGQLNKKPNASYRLAALTLLLAFGVIGTAALAPKAASVISKSDLNPSTSELVYFSVALFLFVITWLSRKFTATIRNHYYTTHFIGGFYRSKGRVPWDGLF